MDGFARAMIALVIFGSVVGLGLLAVGVLIGVVPAR